ncbi:MAG: sigma-70 family RNA polymerase sigma factor [Bacteroidota bacterium]
MRINHQHPREGRYTDAKLVALIRAGGRKEARAHRDLYQHLRPRIVQWVRQRGGTESDGKDAFQVGMIAFHTALSEERFSGPIKVRAYIWKAAQNTWYLRRNRSAGLFPLAEDFDPADPAGGEWLRELLHDEIHRAEILALFEVACPGCKLLLERHFFEQHSNEAIADFLGQKVNSIKVKRSRCLRSLREYLQRHPHAADIFRLDLFPLTTK